MKPKYEKKLFIKKKIKNKKTKKQKNNIKI